jgi:hypothetical protein
MKTRIFFLLAFLASIFVTKAQPDCSICPPLSIFSNPPDITQSGGFSDDQNCYTCYDNFFGISEPIGEVVFWGLNIVGGNGPSCIPTTPKVFEITFYANQSGSVGSVIASFQLTPTEINCGTTSLYNGADYYQYTAELPSTVNLSDGWISIRSVGSSDGCLFAWSSSSVGDAVMWQDCNGIFTSYSLDMAYCLLPAEAAPPYVPVSGWAIGFLMLFISIFTFRKLRFSYWI